ncbi:MAG TPA: hypothetical protein EYQ54_01545 [Myxococcales bacterium]|nr:hypothetical protein [Myxococcales bacterium]
MEPQPSPREWVLKHLVVGLSLAFFVGILGRSVVVDPEIGWGSALLLWLCALALTTAFGGLSASIVGAITSPLTLLDSGRTHWVARWVSGLCAGFATALYGLACAARILTGSFPTVIVWDMFSASPSQFMHAGLVGNTLYIVGALALWLGVAWLVSRALSPAGLPRPKLPLKGRLARVPEGLSPGRRCARVPLVFGSFGIVVALLSDASGLGWLVHTETVERVWVNSLVAPDEGTQSHLEVITGNAASRAEQLEAWSESVAASKGERPNVLLVMLESVSPDHLGVGGYERDVSPHIDALAARGWHYQRVWSSSAQSNYAQMAILSSLLPIRHNRLDKYKTLNYPRFLMHNILAELGYATATISSQNEEWQGMKRFQSTGVKGHVFKHSLDHPGPHIGKGKERKLPDHVTVKLAIQWLNKQAKKDKAWGLYVNLQRTHFPYKLPRRHKGIWFPAKPEGRFSFLNYDEDQREAVVNRYDNALHYTDEQIGKLVDWVEQSGEAQDTIIIVISDHGERFGEGGHVTHGKTVDDGETRIPWIMVWPGHLEPAQIPHPASSIDLMPTLASLLEIPPHPSFQGHVVTPDTSDGSVIGTRLQGLKFLDSVVCWPWKLVFDYTGRKKTLFRLDHDPLEEDDLFEREKKVEQRLLMLLKRQRDIQLAWHRDPNKDPRGHRAFAPRVPRCPDLPN